MTDPVTADDTAREALVRVLGVWLPGWFHRELGSRCDHVRTMNGTPIVPPCENWADSALLPVVRAAEARAWDEAHRVMCDEMRHYGACDLNPGYRHGNPYRAALGDGEGGGGLRGASDARGCDLRGQERVNALGDVSSVTGRETGAEGAREGNA